MRTQRFGIEIEMTGITRKEAADVVAEYFGGLTHQVGGAYDEYHVFDTKARTWKIVSDASIVPMKKEQGKLVEAFSRDYKVELVSPILTYQDIEPMQELVRKLRAAGAVSDNQYSSGIHIHVDAKPHTPNTLKNLVNLMASKEHSCIKLRFGK